MSLRFFNVAERPDLREARRHVLHDAGWPEYMYHDPVAGRYWSSLYDDFPELQFFQLDGRHLIGQGNAIPVRPPAVLPDDGWDWAIGDGGRSTGEPTAVSALQIQVHVRRRGEGLSRVMLEHMREIVASAGFDELVAPVRPTLKASYPLTPIERFIEWRREDGLLLDPWLRVHERAGAELVRVAPESMQIPGTVSEWEGWTGLAFPDTGSYVLPEALTPVEIDRERDRGLYVEPNVWMRHRL